MKKGFTLTEVLIALSIIGVIAAMTIPNLIVSVGQTKTKTQLLKFLADMEQAISLYEYNGGSWASALASDTALRTALTSVIKTQNSGTKEVSIKYASGGVRTSGTLTYITLKNGVEMILYQRNSNCNLYNVTSCASFYVDLDGYGNGLNRLANDVYIFSIDKNTTNDSYSFVAYGSQAGHVQNPVTGETTGRCSSPFGQACAAEILGGLDSLY